MSMVLLQCFQHQNIELYCFTYSVYITANLVFMSIGLQYLNNKV
jgi:hypothetical protein